MTHNELWRFDQCSTFKVLPRLEVRLSQCQRNRKNEKIFKNLPKTKKLIFHTGYNEQPRMWFIIFFNIAITSAQYVSSLSDLCPSQCTLIEKNFSATRNKINIQALKNKAYLWQEVRNKVCSYSRIRVNRHADKKKWCCGKWCANVSSFVVLQALSLEHVKITITIYSS